MLRLTDRYLPNAAVSLKKDSSTGVSEERKLSFKKASKALDVPGRKRVQVWKLSRGHSPNTINDLWKRQSRSCQVLRKGEKRVGKTLGPEIKETWKVYLRQLFQRGGLIVIR